jgi:starch synthase
MRVLFVTSEMAGLYKIGGLGDVSRSLPIALKKLRVDIRVAMPYYKAIELKNVHCVGQIAVDFDGKRELVFIFESKIPGSAVPIYLIRHPKLNDYHGDDIVSKFAFFSCCIGRLYEYAPAVLGGKFDIVHCHDWHTALVPLLLGESNKLRREAETLESIRTKTVLTIHNLLYQGGAPVSLIKTLNLPKRIFHILLTKKGFTIKQLREGLEHADIISTVSPTYAKEMLTGDYGQHVNEALARRRRDVVGIVNGIDNATWDPRSDVSLAVHYGREDLLPGKQANKEYVQRILKLPVAKLPLLGFVGRLEVRQKGIDILIAALSHLLPDGVQVIILGTGPKKIKQILVTFAKKYPDHFVFVPTFDERLARRIYAGADMLVVPSKFEPCGLTQMIAMRYGTIPLVRKTGGLADTVTDPSAGSGPGTGFVFEQYNESALLAKLKEAIVLWNTNPRAWQRMAVRCMRKDFSWIVSAKKYKALYHKLLAGSTL